MLLFQLPLDARLSHALAIPLLAFDSVIFGGEEKGSRRKQKDVARKAVGNHVGDLELHRVKVLRLLLLGV